MDDTESTATSIDENTENFCENPTRDTLAEGLMGLLKPTIDQLDERVRATRISQSELKQQIEILHEELRKIAELQQYDLDLDVYVKKLVSAKHKVTIALNILQCAQDRLNKIHAGIEKETIRRKALLEKLPTPVQSPPPISQSSSDDLGHFGVIFHIMDTPFLNHLTSHDYMNVYEPAEDSFLLLDALENDLNILIERKPLLIAEVGSGSGVIITALSKGLGGISKVFCLATDINLKASETTKKTSVLNNAYVECLNMDLLLSFKESIFDVIVFNPPYVVTSNKEITGNGIERAWAGGHCGRVVIDKFLLALPNFLTEYGICYIVAIEENEPEELCNIMKQKGYNANIIKQRKVRGEFLSILRFSKLDLSCS